MCARSRDRHVNRGGNDSGWNIVKRGHANIVDLHPVHVSHIVVTEGHIDILTIEAARNVGRFHFPIARLKCLAENGGETVEIVRCCRNHNIVKFRGVVGVFGCHIPGNLCTLRRNNKGRSDQIVIRGECTNIVDVGSRHGTVFAFVWFNF